LNEVERVAARLGGSGGFDDHVGVGGIGRTRSERGRKRVPRAAPADRGDVAPGIGDAGAEHQADRPGAEHGHEAARLHVRALDDVQAARERVCERPLGRVEPAGDGVEVDLGDPRGHDDALGERAFEQRGPAAELLALGQARRAVPARRRRSRDDAEAAARVDPGELAPERRRRSVERVGSAGEAALLLMARQRHLDLDHDVPDLRLRARHIVHPEVARSVEA